MSKIKLDYELILVIIFLVVTVVVVFIEKGII